MKPFPHFFREPDDWQVGNAYVDGQRIHYPDHVSMDERQGLARRSLDNL